jgi:glucan phosphorylase
MTIAYFSMEFGLSEALPIYSGGLGILAGDHLKTASDLGVPIVGIGLLYQQGYFRQVIDAGGAQTEFYPYNDPSQLPILPVRDSEGEWLRMAMDFPGRKVRFRVWEAKVGRVRMYLLDSNDPANSPADQCITAELYGGGPELQLQQEIALGIGLDGLLAIGRREPSDATEPFNMAYLAIRGAGRVNGVSRLHGEVSRRIFQPLFPRWPQTEVPVTHVTNGVHVPSWDSAAADELWHEACGKKC